MQETWNIPWYTTRKRCITILYHATQSSKAKTLLNFGGNKVAAHHGKVGCNTVEYTTVFLHSDWLYFLWHCINPVIGAEGVGNDKDFAPIFHAIPPFCAL